MPFFFHLPVAFCFFLAFLPLVLLLPIEKGRNAVSVGKWSKKMTNEKMTRTFGCVLLMLHLQFLSSCLQGERGVSEIEQWRRKESTPQLTLGSLICGLCVFFVLCCLLLFFEEK